MGQPIEQRASQPFGAEDFGPFVEGQIRGDQRCRLFVCVQGTGCGTLAACQKGYRVRFTTAAALVNELLEARDDKRLLRFQKQLAK